MAASRNCLNNIIIITLLSYCALVGLGALMTSIRDVNGVAAVACDIGVYKTRKRPWPEQTNG